VVHDIVEPKTMTTMGVVLCNYAGTACCNTVISQHAKILFKGPVKHKNKKCRAALIEALTRDVKRED